jgi:hypothetical protein
MELNSSHLSGTWKFQVAPRFLENLCTAGMWLFVWLSLVVPISLPWGGSALSILYIFTSSTVFIPYHAHLFFLHVTPENLTAFCGIYDHLR